MVLVHEPFAAVEKAFFGFDWRIGCCCCARGACGYGGRSQGCGGGTSFPGSLDAVHHNLNQRAY
jgi:hypothetical protein